MEIVETIQDWDGKSTVSLELFFDEFMEDKRFLPACLECLLEVELQSGATWFLKRYAETKGAIESDQTNQVCRLLSTLSGWESKLHVLQSVPLMRIDYNHQQALEDFVRDCLADKNKMVRAWALNGFFVLANLFPEYQKEASVLLESSLADESAAVRARARNILKASEFLT